MFCVRVRACVSKGQVYLRVHRITHLTKPGNKNMQQPYDGQVI